MVIAIDFDGTCVTHAFPEIGSDIGAVPVLKWLVKEGHKLVLNTMRSNKKGDRNTLDEAVDWFKSQGIPLFGINAHPTQWKWTNSKKVYADLYIDDASLGAPLKYDPSISARPFIDWEKVFTMLGGPKP